MSVHSVYSGTKIPNFQSNLRLSESFKTIRIFFPSLDPKSIS